MVEFQGRKKIPFRLASAKPDAEYFRELLISVLNGIHMANLRGNDFSRTTLGAGPLLQVNSMNRVLAGCAYVEKVVRRFGGRIEKTRKVAKKGDVRFLVLGTLTTGILKMKINPVRMRLRQERKKRELFEGAPRRRVKTMPANPQRLAG